MMNPKRTNPRYPENTGVSTAKWQLNPVPSVSHSEIDGRMTVLVHQRTAATDASNWDLKLMIGVKKGVLPGV